MSSVNNQIPVVTFVPEEGHSGGDSRANNLLRASPSPRVLLPVQFLEDSLSMRTSASSHFGPRPSYPIVRREYGQTDLVVGTSRLSLFRTQGLVNIREDTDWLESSCPNRRHSSVWLWYPRSSGYRMKLGDTEPDLNRFHETHSAMVLLTQATSSVRSVMADLIAEFEVYRGVTTGTPPLNRRPKTPEIPSPTEK